MPNDCAPGGWVDASAGLLAGGRGVADSGARDEVLAGADPRDGSGGAACLLWPVARGADCGSGTAPSRGIRATADRLVPEGSSAIPRMIISARSIRIRRLGVLTSNPETTAPSRPEWGCGGTGSLTTEVRVAMAVP